MDRDSTIADFKSGVLQIMVATSVAARGLDVKELNVVINYQCPNHMEDYVHRVGRTGRAGRKGTAYTFISQDEERYTPDIVQALKSSGAPIPEALQTMADGRSKRNIVVLDWRLSLDVTRLVSPLMIFAPSTPSEFMAKVKRGDAKLAGSGFGGRGLERIEKEREQAKIAQKKVDNKEAEIAGIVLIYLRIPPHAHTLSQTFGDEEEEEEADEAADEDELRDDGGMAVSTAPSAPMEVDGGDQRSAVEAASVSIAGTGVADASKPQQPGVRCGV